MRFRPVLTSFLLALTCRFGFCQYIGPNETATVTTSAQQPFTLPTFCGEHHHPTVAAFYYIWYIYQWLTNLDMIPELGEYQSNDPTVISQHMQWLKQAGVDDIIISWWGTNSANGTGIDANVAPVMAAAAQNGIQVIFMIDEYTGRTPQTVESDVQYLINSYSKSPAWYTSTRVSPAFDNASVKPVFLVYYAGTDVGPKPSDWTAVNAYIHQNYNAVMLVHYDYDPTWTTAGGFERNVRLRRGGPQRHARSCPEPLASRLVHPDDLPRL